jgi:hypothetical protein
MSNSTSRRNRLDPRTSDGKNFWILYLMLLIFSGIAVLFLILPGLPKPLYTLLASIIALTDTVLLSIFAPNPNPAERQKVTVMLVTLNIGSFLLSGGMWLSLIPTRLDFWLSLSVGLLASQLTALVVFHYQRQRKLNQQ